MKKSILLFCVFSLVAMERPPRRQSLAQRIANKCALCCIGSAIVSQGVYEHDVSDEGSLPPLPPEALLPDIPPSRAEQTREYIKRKEIEQKK